MRLNYTPRQIKTRIVAIIGLIMVIIAFGIALFARPLARCGTEIDCANIC